VASHPTAADARAYFDSWVELYQDFYQFPANLPVDIDHGFDTYKVTYCTVDVALPGKARPAPTVAIGNVSVPPQGRAAGHPGLPARHLGLLLRRPVEPERHRRAQRER